MGAETKPGLQPNQGLLDRAASFPVAIDEVQVRTLVVENPGDFGGWTSLIAEIEKTTPDDMGRICQIYDSFLSEFPLCYGYWKKYADHWARLCNISKSVEVYERAVQSATYSLHIWVHYCSFGMVSFEDPADVRRLFERGMSFVGKDYLSYLLWDKYIEFEYSQKQWGYLAYVYVRTISFPTKKLQSYYESFKTFAAIWEEEIISQNRDAAEVQSETSTVCEIHDAKACEEKEILRIIQDLLDPGAGIEELKKFLSAGIHFYQRADELDAKIKGFENHIRRSYFHVKLLDDVQLENWHHYLDFVELQGDFDWAIKLYERCLIPCANYPEFWIRYVEFVEARGGREIANLALARATQVFLKRVPGIHLFCAKFKEQIGDIFGARAAFPSSSTELSSDFIENVVRKANMEKRLGNAEAASLIYEQALDMVTNSQNQQTLSILFNHFCQFYMASGNVDAARDVLMRGLKHLPYSKFLLEKLIHFEMMHGGQKKIDVIGSIVAQMTAQPIEASEGLSTKEREEISNLFLEFVDLCGTIHEIKKAWECHRRLFPYQMRPTACNDNAFSKISMGKVRVARDESLGPLLNHASGDDKIPGDQQQPLLLDTAQRDANLQSDEALPGHSQQKMIGNGSRHGLELVESAEVVEGHSRLDADKDVALCDSVHEDISTQLPDESIEPAASTEQTQLEVDHLAEDNLKPPLDLGTLSIDHQGDEPPDSNTAKSSNKTQDITSTDGAHSASNTEYMQSDMLPDAYTHEQTNSPQRASTMAAVQDVATSTNDEAPDSTPAKSAKAPDLSSTDGAHFPLDAKCMQSDIMADSYTHEEPYSQQSAPIIAASQHNVKASGNDNRVGHSGHSSRDGSSHRHAEAKRLPQRQASAQQRNSEAELHSQMVINEAYTYQQPPWQVPQVHQANQQHSATAAQVSWTAPNMQQQAFPSIHQSQQSVPSISHPQAPPYQNPAQFSQQQGTMHYYPGYNPQMWYYYQQQQQLQLQTQLQHLHPQAHPQQQQQLQPQQLQEQLQLRQPQQPQVNPQQWQQQQQKEALPQQQQQQLLPQPQILHQQQQVHLQQQHQLQQQQINPHIQQWNNYYQQHAVLTQYHANNQYGHQDIGSQAPIAADELNSEQSGLASSDLQEQVYSIQ